MRIEGQDGSVLEVTPQGEVLVKGDRWAAAVDRGDAYIFHSQDENIAAAGTMIALRNDNPTRKLVIDRVLVINGNVATRYEVHRLTAAYTSAGDVVEGVNANGAYANIANGQGVTCHANETGETQAEVFMDVGGAVAVATYGPFQLDMKLQAGQAVAVDQVTESDSGAATLFAYFEDA